MSLKNFILSARPFFTLLCIVIMISSLIVYDKLLIPEYLLSLVLSLTVVFCYFCIWLIIQNERREATRFARKEIAKITHPAIGELKTSTANLSNRGAFIVIDNILLPLGSNIHIQIENFDGIIVNTTAELTRIEKGKGIGLSF